MDKSKQLKEIGARIKAMREAMDMSQEMLAEKVGYKSRSSINKIEMGKNDIVQSTIKKIADALDTTPAYIMGWNEANSMPVKNLFPVPDTYRVPRLGQIACGAPTLAEQNIETYDAVPVTIKCDFTLLCKGDSMIGAGIEDGDIVYIREQPEVETGEIAAVMVGEDEATLKRFKRVGNTILLIPENSNYEPLVFSGGEMNGVRILGKAVGFTRQFEK